MLLSLLSILLLPAQEVPVQKVDAPINRVTVYDGQALVERQFSVTATEPGAVSIHISPLPLGLDSSSFQTKLIDGEVVVQGVDARTVTGTALDNSARDELRKQLADLRTQRRAQDHLRSAIVVERSGVDAIVSAIATGKKPEEFGLDIAELGSMAASLDMRMAAYENEVAALDIKINDLDHRLGQGGRQLHRYKEGTVQLWFERPGTAVLNASYLIGGASWRPTYDVRVAPDLTGITVGLVGHLAQKTGEDWTEAEIALSTSTPSIGLEPPSLPTRVFDFYERYRGMTAAAPASEALADLGYLHEEADADNDAIFLGVRMEQDKRYKAAPTVSVQDLGITALFQLPERKTIASDGEPHRFRIREVPLDVSPERYVVPTLSDQAFLRAEVTYNGDVPMLPGVAKIFLGPDYLGESKFPVMRPGDSTVVPLGLDPNLSVKWETVVDKREDPGLLSSTAVLSRVYRATLKLSANAPGDILVVMEESIPIVRTNQMTLTPIELRPAPQNSDDDKRLQEERGLYQWRIQLAPGQGQNVYWGYELRFDEDYNPVLREE